MNNYQDKYGFYHDAPVGSDGLTSSGNAFFYTAIAKKLGIVKDLSPGMVSIIVKCAVERTRHVTSDNSKGNPFSRDEALGICELGYGHLIYRRDGKFSWSFSPKPIPKFSLWLTIVQFFHLVDPHTGKQKHATTFWKEGYDQVYRFAYQSPISDRYYINKCLGRWYNPIYHLIHILSHLKKETRRSQRQLAWFRTGKDIQAVANYFPKDHPFQEYVK